MVYNRPSNRSTWNRAERIPIRQLVPDSNTDPVALIIDSSLQGIRDAGHAFPIEELLCYVAIVNIRPSVETQPCAIGEPDARIGAPLR